MAGHVRVMLQLLQQNDMDMIMVNRLRARAMHCASQTGREKVISGQVEIRLSRLSRLGLSKMMSHRYVISDK